MNTTPKNPVAAAKRAGRNALDESAGKQLLAAHGVKVPQSRVAKGVADVDAVMNGLQMPVVVKVMSPDILHKSDAGGVRLNIVNAPAVRNAYHDIIDTVQKRHPNAKINGVSIEPFLSRPNGRELMIGVAQVIGMKPILRSFFSSAPFSCAMASNGFKGVTRSVRRLALRG